MSNQQLTEGYYIREYGIYALDPEDGEILYDIFIVGQEDVEWIEPYDTAGLVNIAINVYLAAENGKDVMSPIGLFDFVSQGDFDAHVNNQEIHITQEEREKRYYIRPLRENQISTTHITMLDHPLLEELQQRQSQMKAETI